MAKLCVVYGLIGQLIVSINDPSTVKAVVSCSPALRFRWWAATARPRHVQEQVHHFKFRSHLHMPRERWTLAPDCDASAVLDYPSQKKTKTHTHTHCLVCSGLLLAYDVTDSTMEMPVSQLIRFDCWHGCFSLFRSVSSARCGNQGCIFFSLLFGLQEDQRFLFICWDFSSPRKRFSSHRLF